VLQLAGQPPTIPKIFVQTSGKQRQGVGICQLRRRAKAFVKRTADNAVMVDQRKRFVRDGGFELIFSRTGACDVRRSSVGRNMIDPVPTQCVVVDREFPCRSFDRGTGGQKPLDAHAFEVLASLTASRPRILFSPHRLPPVIYPENPLGRKRPPPEEDCSL